MREEKAEDPGERGGELQKFTPGALGGGCGSWGCPRIAFARGP